ncbi:TolC family protein [Oxalobacteraceae bacterium A2-2]
MTLSSLMRARRWRAALLPLMLACGACHAEVLTLAQAQQRAAARNTDLRLAALGVEGAAANSTIAGAAPNPVLTVQSANINPGLGVGGGSLRAKTVDSTVRIDQLIERGGKRALRTEAAGHLERAARDDLGDSRRQLSLQVTLAYCDWQAAVARLAVLRDSAALAEAMVTAARRRQQAGDLAAVDVARASVDALRARNDAQQAGTDAVAARLALAALLGGPELTDTEPEPQAAPAAPPEAPAGDAMLEHRPDVRAALDRVEAARSARKLALAQRSSDVTVGVQFEHYPASAANPQGSGNSYGIALQVPLQWRYAYQGELRAADVALLSAEENLEKIRRQARTELLLGASQARDAWQRLRRGEDELLPAARQAASAAEYAFQRGALGIMDVLDVRRSERAAQLDVLASRNDYAKSLAAWRAALTESPVP